MAFIISLILIWGLALTLLLVNPQNKANRWGSFVAFVVGLHYLANVFTERLIPVLANDPVNAGMLSWLKPASTFLTAVSFLFYPYGLTIFSLSYTRLFSESVQKMFKILLLIPILMLYLLIPVRDFLYPSIRPSYVYLTLWSTINIFTANILLLVWYYKTVSRDLKKEAALICIFIVPTTLFGWSLNFLGPILGVHNLWRYNIYVVVTLFLIYGYLINRHGFLGMRIRFERKSLDNAIRTMTTGSDVLNHALKNEISKISLCSRNIEAARSKFDQETFERYIGENVKNILYSSGYLMKIMKRINDYTGDITLIESCANLSEIIEDAVNLVVVFLSENKIKLKRNYLFGEYGYCLYCDPVHLKEVINNILRNAIDAINVTHGGDAIENGGEIEIRIVKTKRQLILEIKDNGCGIPRQNLPYVISPYFSTKRNALNYGLGLSYCYNVMQKHDGKLEIESIENKGTIIFLKFPVKRLIKKPEHIERRF